METSTSNSTDKRFDLVSFINSDEPPPAPVTQETNMLQYDFPALVYPAYPMYGGFPGCYQGPTYLPAGLPAYPQYPGHLPPAAHHPTAVHHPPPGPQISPQPPPCQISPSQTDQSMMSDQGNESGYVSMRSSCNPSPEPEDSKESLRHLVLAQDPEPQPQHQPQQKDVDTYNPHPRPDDSYIAMIAKAILSAADEEMLLGDIYSYVMKNYPYFQNSKPSWRNCIRHNLSTHGCFTKSRRAKNGKGFYWSIHPTCLQSFREGEFDRRTAKRLVQLSHKVESTPDCTPVVCKTEVQYSTQPVSLVSTPGYAVMQSTPVTDYDPCLNQNVVKKRLGQREKTELYYACARLLGY